MGGEVEREVAVKGPGVVRLGLLSRLALFLAVMGPGLITGAVDNDPAGIAGYSIAGSRFGYSLLWAIVLCVIALAIIAEIAARLGAITGRGLADLIRERFGVRITTLAMLVLLVANATTTVAEFAGVAGASEIFGVSKYLTVPLVAALVLALVVFGTYHRVEKVLLLGSLVFVAYIITGFLARPDWGSVATHSVVPTFHFTLPYLTILIGVIGTTITPWQQFYLQSGVVDKGLGEREYRFVRWDVYAGAIACTVIAFFVIVTTAATLHAHGDPADTVEDVGRALHPLAGDFAANLFAIGLLNASLLAVTVLPLSTAYAVCGAFGWERSVNRRLREAPAFFGLFAALIIGGAAAVLIPRLDLLVLLFLPNVVGGILLPVILILMLKLVNDRRIMGRWTNSPRQNAVAWATTIVLIVLAVVYALIALLQAAGVVNA